MRSSVGSRLPFKKASRAIAPRSPHRVTVRGSVADRENELHFQDLSRRAVLLGGPSALYLAQRYSHESPGARKVGLLMSSSPTLPASEVPGVVAYVFEHAERGNTDSILTAIDSFNSRFPLNDVGVEKGVILESLVRSARPQNVVQLGTYVGYSALRIARALPPGGTLICVESSQEAVDTATEVLKYAGLWGKLPDGRNIVVEQGASAEMLPNLAARLQGPAQLVIEDHSKCCYLPDLLSMELHGVVAAGTIVVADNVISPGAPQYLKYLRNSENGYAAAMIPASFHQNDALVVAVRGRPGADVSRLAVSLNAAVVAVRRSSSIRGSSVYGVAPSVELRRAVTKLQHMCKGVPSGKRCAPIPPLYA